MKPLCPSILLSIAAAFSLCQISPTIQSQDREQNPPREQKQKGRKGESKIAKPKIADTVRATIYADNWFKLYLNGNLVAVDSISFIPHNVVSVDILPEYPMTIAVMARDNADPETALEYNNTNIGDGGFILKFGDGTVTDASWKAKNFFHGPVDNDLRNPKVEKSAIPATWHEVDFDDSNWAFATEHEEESVGPKDPFYENDFAGAKWIWTEDLALDNTVIFRKTILSPPNGTPIPKNWPRGKIDAAEKNKAIQGKK